MKFFTLYKIVIKQFLMKKGDNEKDATEKLKYYDMVSKMYKGANSTKKAEIMSSLWANEAVNNPSFFDSKSINERFRPSDRKVLMVVVRDTINKLRKKNPDIDRPDRQLGQALNAILRAMTREKSDANYRQYKKYFPKYNDKLLRRLATAYFDEPYNVQNTFIRDAMKYSLKDVIPNLKLMSFYKYMGDFYGKKGIYPDKKGRDLKVGDIDKALLVYKKKWGASEFEGDTLDRERVRDILIKMRKLDPDYSKKESVNEKKGVPGSVFTIDTAKETSELMTKALKKVAPDIRRGQIYYSDLGGADRVSIVGKFSLDPKKTWANNILENSRFITFHLDNDGTLEVNVNGYPFAMRRKVQMRKSRNNDIKQVLKRMITHFSMLNKKYPEGM